MTRSPKNNMGTWVYTSYHHTMVHRTYRKLTPYYKLTSSLLGLNPFKLFYLSPQFSRVFYSSWVDAGANSGNDRLFEAKDMSASFPSASKLDQNISDIPFTIEALLCLVMIPNCPLLHSEASNIYFKNLLASTFVVKTVSSTDQMLAKLKWQQNFHFPPTFPFHQKTSSR